MKGIETLLVSMMFYGTDEVVSTTAARAALWIQMFEAKRCSWLKAFYEPLKLFWEGSDGDLDAPVLRHVAQRLELPVELFDQRVDAAVHLVAARGRREAACCEWRRCTFVRVYSSKEQAKQGAGGAGAVAPVSPVGRGRTALPPPQKIVAMGSKSVPQNSALNGSAPSQRQAGVHQGLQVPGGDTAVRRVKSVKV